MKKIIPYILIFVLLVGFFSPIMLVYAQTESTEISALKSGVESLDCIGFFNGSLEGCIVKASYYLFFVLPAFILTIVGNLFNALLGLTLSRDLYAASFISEAWKIVRDMSNIFFILILLYTAVMIILDLGHENKKVISRIIIIALIINFSMFFTKVVIDSSNILALIFYNKISVAGPGGTPRPYDQNFEGGLPEKDFGGAIVSSFDPARLMTPEMFDRGTRTITVGTDYSTADEVYCSTVGSIPPSSYALCLATKTPIATEVRTVEGPPVGASLYLGIIFVSCAIFLFAAYALFIAGISFLGRLIELWILIIFSPFAFISSTIPFLDKIEGFGWSSWFKRLLTTAFMAPIFMFFLYLISKIIGAMGPSFLKPSATNNETTAKILMVVIPAVIILSLLLKAASYAKKGGGAFGEMIMKGGAMVGGLALGAATGGAAFALSNTVGRKARNVANDDELRIKAASGDKGAQRKLALANSLAKNSFDFRQTGLGKFTQKQTGMNFDRGLGMVGMSTEKLKGGRAQRDKEKYEKGEEIKKSYELSPAAARAQDEKAKRENEPKDKQNARAAQYEADKEQARQHLGGFKGDQEKYFKEAYEHGDTEFLKAQAGITRKNIDAGSVERDESPRTLNAEQTNLQRREAYILSLENPNKKIEKGQAIKKGWRDYKDEILRGSLSGTGKGTIATGAVVGMAMGGPIGAAIGAALAIPLGGLAGTIKDILKAQAQASISFLAEDKNLIAKLAKGKSSEEKILEALKGRVEPGKEKEVAHGITETIRPKTEMTEKKDTDTTPPSR